MRYSLSPQINTTIDLEEGLIYLKFSKSGAKSILFDLLLDAILHSTDYHSHTMDRIVMEIPEDLLNGLRNKHKENNNA